MPGYAPGFYEQLQQWRIHYQLSYRYLIDETRYYNVDIHAAII